MRVAIGGINHENGEFSPIETPLSYFDTMDAEAMQRRDGTINTVVDG